MHSMLSASAAIDRLLSFIAKFGAWAGLMLILVVCFDVVTRYFGVPKPFGMNSTQVQESEYWMHTILFSLVIGFAYTKQSHVRIDLIRAQFKRRTQYLIEIFGILFFLIPFSLMAIFYNSQYVSHSFQEGEASKSLIGLTHIWILKSFLVTLFVLLLLAGISQLIKAIAGLRGELPEERVAETLGGDA